MEKSNQLAKLKGLYILSDTSLVSYEELPSLLEVAFGCGVGVFQLRDKSEDKSHLIDTCKQIRALCDKFDALFIVDDDVEFALTINADGVHIGKDDMSIEESRRILGHDKIIGVSCYDDLDRAVDMQKRGADYAAFGAFYPSTTKPNAKLADKKILTKAKKLLTIPMCAIGGITSKNVAELVDAGADMVAVITDIWRSEDLQEKIKTYTKIFNDK